MSGPVLCMIHCPVCGSDTAGSNEMAINKELHLLRSRLALLEKACQMALTVGTAYPSDTSARMDSHTEAVLRAALKSAGEGEKVNADLQNKWSEIVRINHDVPAIQAADAEIKRLREAVEWALGYADACGEMDTYKAELRRRAKESDMELYPPPCSCFHGRDHHTNDENCDMCFCTKYVPVTVTGDVAGECKTLDECIREFSEGHPITEEIFRLREANKELQRRIDEGWEISEEDVRRAQESVCPSCAALQEKLDASEAQIRELEETSRMMLVAISVVSFANTQESAKNARLPKGHEYWTPTHDDVCTAVDREIALRSRLALAEKIAGKLAGIVEREMAYIDVDNLTTQHKYSLYQDVVNEYRALRAYDAALKSDAPKEGEGK